MAEYHAGDVDRAMAAFAAAPMPYSNFGASPMAQGNRSGGTSVAPADAARTSGDAAGREPGPKNAVAFPLLIDALPGLTQSGMPVPPSGMSMTQERFRTAVPTPGRTAPMIGTPRPVDRQTGQSSGTRPSSELTGGESDLTDVFGLPFGSGRTTRPRAPLPLPRSLDNGATPLAAVFHVLQATSPSHAGPFESRAGLQDIFSRL
jgi:hypothetical protein